MDEEVLQAGRRGSLEGSSSLHEEILPRLRDLMSEGDLAPGSRVPERELCDLLQVSRTPLREALKVLSAEGLVELLPNRGARVRELSEREIRELFEVVAGLEFLTGQLACEAITDGEIVAIELLHYDMYTHYVRNELVPYFHLNERIHDAIVDAARNTVLRSAYATYNARIKRVRYAANLDRDRWSVAMREHEAMLDALRRREGQELGLLLFGHMRSKCDAACERFRAEGKE